MNVADFFRHTFEPGLIEQINNNSTLRHYAAGEVIIEKGELLRTMPLLLSGNIKVSRIDDDGREFLMYYVNALESCAMTFTCCMQQNTSEIRAVAETDVQLLAVPIRFMDIWMAEYPTWKNFVMKSIRNRFSELLSAIDQLAFQKLDERLIHYLKEKSKANNSTVINLSHEQIANDLATSRVVVSRLLKKLEDDKKLVLYRNQLKILREL